MQHLNVGSWSGCAFDEDAIIKTIVRGTKRGIE
jgi:hypothetical protein